MPNQQNLVLYIGHPFDLAYFMRLLPLINEKKQFYVTAIVAKGYYFKDMDNLNELLNKISDECFVIPDNKIPGYSRHLLKGIKNTLFVKKLIRNIDKNNSILISIDKSQFIANYLNSHFKKIILIQGVDPLDLKDYKPAYLKMAWFNLINIITGSKLIFLRHNKKSSGHIWHYTVYNLKPAICYLTEDESVKNRIVLPEIASENKSKRIIIFGSRYNDWKFINNNKSEIKTLVFLFYKNLKQTFPEHIFYYKPHPRENGSEYAEINQIFDNQLINVGISLNSELFLIENNDIEHCFSLGSTSSRSAYEMGFSSKVFYKLLNFEKEIEKVFDGIFSEMQRTFFIKDLQRLDDLSRKEPTKNYLQGIKNYLYELSYL